MEAFYSLIGLTILMAVIPAYIAKIKGRSFGLFLLYGLLLGPIAIIHALIMKRENGGHGSKKCPYCAERIQQEAIVCKHCGRDLPPLQATLPDRTLEPSAPIQSDLEIAAHLRKVAQDVAESRGTSPFSQRNFQVSLFVGAFLLAMLIVYVLMK